MQAIGHQANAVVAIVRDVDLSLAVDGDAHRSVEPSVAAVTVEEATDRAYQRTHLARRVDASDSLVAAVAEQDTASGVDGDPPRVVHLRGLARAVEVARLARARDRGDGAVGFDVTDAVVDVVGDVDVALAIDSDTHRLVELRGAALTVCKTACAAGQRGDRAVGEHLADAVVVAVSDEHSATLGDRDAVWLVEARVGALAVSEAASGAR